ncbi:MAG: hypothetical protein U1D30_02500 [Planctomycetota bacterium]
MVFREIPSRPFDMSGSPGQYAYPEYPQRWGRVFAIHPDASQTSRFSTREELLNGNICLFENMEFTVSRKADPGVFGIKPRIAASNCRGFRTACISTDIEIALGIEHAAGGTDKEDADPGNQARRRRLKWSCQGNSSPNDEDARDVENDFGRGHANTEWQ